ncbi:MAG TPA: hypothetical protein VHV80_07920 [Steroidobacteraceae bacterium]|jgi:hypothetical protein|nr:hypothetical protein [Steroidobacteraceae bacterium]
MSHAAYLPRLRQALLSAVALLRVASALVLLALGIALLIAGLLSWLRPVNVASAWARTLAGVGLVGGSAGFAAFAWLAFRGWARRQTVMNRKLKFAAVIGSLLALICLPFGAAIGAITHVSWFG